MSPVSSLPNSLERPTPAARQVGATAPAVPAVNPFSNTTFGAAAASNDVFFSSNSDAPTGGDTSAADAAARAGLFGTFASFMDKPLVRYTGYFNEIAASLGHSYFPEKHYDPNKWWQKGNPNWFKGLNFATWAYAGLDVFAKAGEAYRRAKADPNSDQSPMGAALRTGFDRALFQTMATIAIPVKIIGGMQKVMDRTLAGKVSTSALKHIKFFGTFLPIPLIAAFVDGGTNMFMDMAVRPWLGTPKHIIDTHGKPHPAANGHDSASAEVSAPASSPVLPLMTDERAAQPMPVFPTAIPQAAEVVVPPLAQPEAPAPHHFLNPFATVGTNFLSGDTPVSNHTLRANVKFNQFAFE